MINKILCLSAVSLSIGLAGALNATTPKALTIREATRKCEQDVTQHCKTVTCSQFCEAAFANRRANKEALITKCKGECTPQNRCKLKPLGGNDDPQNRELDAQNRDQLIACIAQMRDPTGEKTGRRMEDWKDLKTPSWRKLIGG